jgi:hypothetical protein
MRGGLRVLKPSSAILRKASAALRDVADGRPIDQREAGRLAEAIAPRLRIRKVLPFKTTKVDKEEKAAAHRQEIGEIRAFCLQRAGGLCECGCGRRLDLSGFELDHWLNGIGRRRQQQSIENCWVLSLRCHGERQRLKPSTPVWNARFAVHARKYGYPVVGHIEHAPTRRRIR